MVQKELVAVQHHKKIKEDINLNSLAFTTTTGSSTMDTSSNEEWKIDQELYEILLE